jgi:hypothetical protein
MNPPDQPTPRTDAAWSKTFEDDWNQFFSGNAANKMRDECANLERELAAAKAELADWSVLKGWGGTPEIVHQFIKGQQHRIHHCQDLEAELITERARLDYLGLHMGTRMVAEALNCDYSKCFPIRDAIDLSMKNKTTIP